MGNRTISPKQPIAQIALLSTFHHFPYLLVISVDDGGIVGAIIPIIIVKIHLGVISFTKKIVLLHCKKKLEWNFPQKINSFNRL